MVRRVRYTTTGVKADDGHDPVMLLKEWAEVLRDELIEKDELDNFPIRFAGVGHPTFPMPLEAPQSVVTAWQKLLSASGSSQAVIHKRSGKSTETWVDDVHAKSQNAVVPYGRQAGSTNARDTMAKALNTWYEERLFESDDILLSTSGAAALLSHIFKVINTNRPYGRILLQKPYYSLYAAHCRRIEPMNSMQHNNFKLTAADVEAALQRATKKGSLDGGMPSAILLNTPHNPTGTYINPDELEKIAKLLEGYKDVYVILDEAYIEMQSPDDEGRRHPASFLNFASKSLLQRTILTRSATKAFSLAGARMAVLATTNMSLMAQLTKEAVRSGGPPETTYSEAYATTLLEYAKNPSSAIADYYQQQVKTAVRELNNIAALPSRAYKPDGAFYIFADLKDLLGYGMAYETERAIKSESSNGNTTPRAIIESDVDIVYHLLFKHGIMLAAGSFFGLTPGEGIVRITCSVGISGLESIIALLGSELKESRRNIQEQLIKQLLELAEQVDKLQSTSDQLDACKNEIAKIQKKQRNGTGVPSAKALKIANSEIKELIHNLKTLQIHASENVAARVIVRAFRLWKTRTLLSNISLVLPHEWKTSVVNFITDKPKKITEMLSYAPRERLAYPLWRQHLANLTGTRAANPNRNGSGASLIITMTETEDESISLTTGADSTDDDCNSLIHLGDRYANDHCANQVRSHFFKQGEIIRAALKDRFLNYASPHRSTSRTPSPRAATASPCPSTQSFNTSSTSALLVGAGPNPATEVPPAILTKAGKASGPTSLLTVEVSEANQSEPKTREVGAATTPGLSRNLHLHSPTNTSSSATTPRGDCTASTHTTSPPKLVDRSGQPALPRN